MAGGDSSVVGTKIEESEATTNDGVTICCCVNCRL